MAGLDVSKDMNDCNQVEDGNVANVHARDVIEAIVTIFALAYSSLQRYQCQECITLLHNLPSPLFSSGYTHQLLGKAYFEMNDYKLCVLAYKEMMRLEPFRYLAKSVSSQ